MKDPAYGRTKWKVEGPPPEKKGPSKTKDGEKETEQETLELPNERTEYLQARKHDLRLDEKIGKSYIIPKQDIGKARSPFYCDICDVNFNDNQTFVDHLNGKKHNRMLGMNMKVKSGSVEGVLARLEFGALLTGQKSKPNIQIVADAGLSQPLGKRAEQPSLSQEVDGAEEESEGGESDQSGEEEEPDELAMQMQQFGLPRKFR